MKLGDLDGLEVLYDKMGQLVFEEGETFIADRSATVMALYDGKRAKGTPKIHNGQGDVTIHLTDRRMVVLVDPSLSHARRVLHLPGGESWTRGKELFEVIQGRGRYYLTLEWSEIPRIRLPSEKKETVNITLRPMDGGVAILLVDRESAAWIEQAWRTSRESG
jgi:hypothetical protein